MSTYDEERGETRTGRESDSAGERVRRRDAPLFHIAADDEMPRVRRRPPAPLADLVGDLDEVMPVRGLPRREPARRMPAEPQGPTGGRQVEPPAAREASRPSAPLARRQPDAQPEPRAVVATTSSRPRQELRVAPLSELVEAPLTAIDAARARYESVDADLARLQLAEARPRLSGGYVAAPAAMGFSTLITLGVICLASLLVLLTLRGGGEGGVSRWNLLGGAGSVEQDGLAAALRPAGDYALQGPPSLTPQQIDRILAAYNSPATGTGQDWYNLGLEYGIDPAFAVAFFIHESSAGSNPNWAGIKPGGATTHNVGNIICAGYATCFGRFRDYPSWAAGIEDWYRLIDVEYLQGRGHRTVADIIPVYAPSFENDVQGYVNAVHSLIDSWRTHGAP